MTIPRKTQPYEKILQLLPNLSAEEQLGLISEILYNLKKMIPAKLNADVTHASAVRDIKGKYANIPTSSERFAQLKQEEIEIEN